MLWLRDAGCDVEAVRIPALEQNNYFDPAITLYGAELGRYVRRFVGDREAELHFVGKIYVSSQDPSLADYIDAEIRTDQLSQRLPDIFRNTMYCCAQSFLLRRRRRDLRNMSSTGRKCRQHI